MPQQLASLAIAIQTNDLKRATQELNKLEKAGLRAEKGTDKLTNSTNKLGSSLVSVKGAVIAFIGSMAIRKVIEYADTMTRLDSQIKLVTNSTEELVKTQADLFALSQDTRQSLEATTNLYARMARASESMGTSQEDLLVATKAVNQALVISGASATEASSTITQLSQALASGVLRGEEFNSISENGSRVAKALADNLGVTVGQLRAMAKEGKLTSDVVMKALIEQAGTLQGEFGQMGVTVEQSMTVLDNSLMTAVGTLDEATGFSKALSSSIVGLSGFIDDMTSPLTLAEIAMNKFADSIKNVSTATLDLELTNITKEIARVSKLANIEASKSYGGVVSGYSRTLAFELTALSQQLKIIKEQKEAIVERNQEASKNGGKDSKIGGITKEEIELSGRAAKKWHESELADLKALKAERDLSGRAAMQWHEDEIADLKEMEKIRQSQLDLSGRAAKQWADSEKEGLKSISKLSGSIQAEMTKSIVSGIKAGIESKSLEGAFKGLASGVGEAMAQEYISSMIAAQLVVDTAAKATAAANPYMLAAGIVLMAVGSFLGSSSSGGKSQAELAEEEFDTFISGLDKASEALFQFGNVGSAISGEITSIQAEIASQKTSLETLESAEIAWKFRKGEGAEIDGEWVSESDIEDMISATRDTISSLGSELSSAVSTTLAETLDISALSTEQIEGLTDGIDIEAMKALDEEYNSLALAMKVGGEGFKDTKEGIETIADATAILQNTDYITWQDNAEAFELLAESAEIQT